MSEVPRQTPSEGQALELVNNRDSPRSECHLSGFDIGRTCVYVDDQTVKAADGLLKLRRDLLTPRPAILMSRVG
jgi:hypothetical protein